MKLETKQTMRIDELISLRQKNIFFSNTDEQKSKQKRIQKSPDFIFYFSPLCKSGTTEIANQKIPLVPSDENRCYLL